MLTEEDKSIVEKMIKEAIQDHWDFWHRAEDY